ncbi:glucose 1-dehydrogenase [Novosphingobium sp. KCTC 2891]|uniref:SDR family NAD(P)-dependent oxidoreductase n=1 Tax=Novosphingobium sp. KCTC 2891 TaxID=2989730 RepID=UPI0022213C7D|nr:glucose 1-dehydrogenase [Novosphingobium sp. KCTC 2891]MCW1384694.1 glucose 1-dehydrogenase [Novosphingobium sp. KCTC 2891]
MTNNAGMDGNVAIVTGGAMGMGEATARLFAERGAKVILADISDEAGKRVVEEIRAAGGEATYVHCDVSNEDEVAAMVTAAVETYGRLDCAVNNAATMPDMAPIHEADASVFDRIITINLKSVLLCMKHELGQMLKQEDRGGFRMRGSIVNIASISGIRPQPGNPAYMAAKSGVIGLSRSASFDYAPRGIRVNTVAPGAIKTPMVWKSFEEFGGSEEEYAPYISLFNRMGEPSEVAEASLWLCSDAASYVTGQVLAVDAGYTTR